MPEHLQAAYATRVTEPHIMQAHATQYVPHKAATRDEETDKLLQYFMLSMKEKDTLRAFWVAQNNRPVGGITDYIA